MLVLGRRKGESLVITTKSGETIRVVVARAGKTVRLGVEAERDVQVHRSEITTKRAAA